uniref:Uncharacterized protein n=1 Tax=Taeniopygia guttata TaxID=59729 RepID=A0A674HMZ7_TAEGU
MALRILLQNVGGFGVTSKAVCRSSRHSAGRKPPSWSPCGQSSTRLCSPSSSMRIRVGWRAGRDTAVHGGPWGRSPSSIATGTLHVMESFPLGLRSHNLVGDGEGQETLSVTIMSQNARQGPAVPKITPENNNPSDGDTWQRLAPSSPLCV